MRLNEIGEVQELTDAECEHVTGGVGPFVAGFVVGVGLGAALVAGYAVGYKLASSSDGSSK